MSIPASEIVAVTPNTLVGGGTEGALNGVILTNGTRIPLGVYLAFPNYAAVSSYFGAQAVESTMALEYFGGYVNSTKKPSSLIFMQLNNTPNAAWLRGANVSGLTIAQLQASSGPLSVTIDGGLFSLTTSLSGATSFSSAATLLQTQLQAVAPVVTTFNGSISGNTLTVAAPPATGTLAIGQRITGTGVTPNQVITAFGTGTGAQGTYILSLSQTLASTAMSGSTALPTVIYDTQSGGFQIMSGITGVSSTITFATGAGANSLSLNSGAGAVLSQGAANTSPMTGLNQLVSLTRNWAFFITTYEPNLSAKLSFAAWIASQNNSFGYISWDQSSTTATQTGDVSSFAYQLYQSGSSGTAPVWAPLNGPIAAAGVLGYIASVDFSAINGRTTAAFTDAVSIVPDVTDATQAATLQANNYNYYGDYATNAQDFKFFYPGTISGPFKWLDSYINQIWMNNNLQLAMMILLTTAKSIPFNQDGYAMIEAAAIPVAEAGKSFGAIRAGVTLTPLQIQQVNADAGAQIDATLSTNGYYFVVKDPGANTRITRGSPLCLFFYVDGESVQSINFSSTNVQ